MTSLSLELLLKTKSSLSRLISASFLLRWVFATTLALAAGAILTWYTPRLTILLLYRITLLLYRLIPDGFILHKIVPMPSYLVANTRVGAVFGVLLGVGQWLALQNRVPWAKSWLWATVGAGVAGYSAMICYNVIDVLLDTDPTLVHALINTGAYMGGMIALAQWLLLRKHVRQAGWWIGVVMLSWVMQYALIELVRLIMPITQTFNLLGLTDESGGVANLPEFANLLAVQLLSLFVVGIFPGLLTGQALVWLLNKSRQAAPAGTSGYNSTS